LFYILEIQEHLIKKSVYQKEETQTSTQSSHFLAVMRFVLFIYAIKFYYRRLLLYPTSVFLRSFLHSVCLTVPSFTMLRWFFSFIVPVYFSVRSFVQLPCSFILSIRRCAILSYRL